MNLNVTQMYIVIIIITPTFLFQYSLKLLLPKHSINLRTFSECL